MSDRLIVVSSDCHAGLPIAQYKPYIEEKYHEIVDMAVPITIEMSQKASESFLIKEINDEWRQGIETELTGAWIYEERVKMLDKDGIAAEIIFPDGITEINTPPFGAGLSMPTKDMVPELQWAGAMAHNRWLAEFCANNPERHHGVAIIPLLWDVELAITNMRWCVDNGFRHVMIPVQTHEFPGYNHLKYDPFWEACQDLGVMVHFHSGPGPMDNYFGPDWPAESSDDRPGAMGLYVSEVMWWLYRPLGFMIWGGVFERYPNLRACMTEGGTNWMLEPWLRMLDFHATAGPESAKLGDYTGHLSMKPSEYFIRNIGVGASCAKRADLEVSRFLGKDKLMWGSDYPHPEGTWPQTETRLAENFSGFPEEDIRKLLGENAIAWYGMSREALAPIAERIGPDASLFQ
jgi:predicted TIM-barrel fold metal-dependent hydrolase